MPAEAPEFWGKAAVESAHCHPVQTRIAAGASSCGVTAWQSNLFAFCWMIILPMSGIRSETYIRISGSSRCPLYPTITCMSPWTYHSLMTLVTYAHYGAPIICEIRVCSRHVERLSSLSHLVTFCPEPLNGLSTTTECCAHPRTSMVNQGSLIPTF